MYNNTFSVSIFSSLSKLISKSKSQSLLPSSTITDPITTQQQHHKVPSSLFGDGVNNNNLSSSSLLKVTNDDGITTTADKNGNNHSTLYDTGNALPNFLKAGLRKSLTQVSGIHTSYNIRASLNLESIKNAFLSHN